MTASGVGLPTGLVVNHSSSTPTKEPIMDVRARATMTVAAPIVEGWNAPVTTWHEGDPIVWTVRWKGRADDKEGLAGRSGS